VEILKHFKEANIKTIVVIGEKGKEKIIANIDGNIIVIPKGVRPFGFKLIVFYPPKMIVARRDISTENGGYYKRFVNNFGVLGENVSFWIPIFRTKEKIWTPWHQKSPNRLDCWILQKDGRVELFQVGIVTHDNGKTFRLLCEPRWKGQFYQDRNRQIVGKPNNSHWGAFDVRRKILDFPAFKDRLQQINFPKWNGRKEELDPPLDPIPGSGFARVSWYTPFAGQTGQGIVILHDGSSAWVQGSDLMIEPNPDGIKRLSRNDLLSYTQAISWGKEKGRLLKLIGVKKVKT
jgi:hypothetical protein